MISKTYRSIIRSLRDKLCKKFIGLRVSSPKSFADTKEYHEINLYICIEDLVDKISFKEILTYLATLSENKRIENSSFLYKINKDESILIKIKFFDSLNKYNFNLDLNSYSELNLILNLIAKAYGCHIDKDGLKYNDILLIDNIYDLLRFFGYEYLKFDRHLTKEQFIEFILSSLYLYPKCILEYNESDNEIINEIKNRILNGEKKYLTEPHKPILNEIEKYIDPNNAIERLKISLTKKSKNVYMSLLNTYINKSMNVNISKLELYYKTYINSLLELYAVVFKDNKQVFQLDENNKITITLLTNRISELKTNMHLFKLNLNDEIEVVYGFKTHVDLSFRELYMNNYIDNLNQEIELDKDIEKLFIEAGNRLNTYISDELAFDFSFILDENDISTILLTKYSDDQKRLNEL